MAKLRNLITDVAGLRVGNTHDEKLRSGVTVLLSDEPMTASVDVRGGATCTRDAHILEPEGTVQEVNGIVLSGGSSFGLDATTGAQSYLRERNIGFQIRTARVPIVPQAILFDLLNGGDKDWGKHPPYRDLAYDACEAAGEDFALGTVGAGYGATTVIHKGGLGSASQRLEDGTTVAALAAVNPVGSVTWGDTRHFLAAPMEQNGEFGGHGWPAELPPDAHHVRFKGNPGENTTLVVVATDAALDRLMLKRLAVMAQTGFARAIYPVHTPLDGDVVFAVSAGKRQIADPIRDLARIGAAAANATARAIARGVYEATAYPHGPADLPAYRDLHSG